jgi:hypothetical protein
LRNAKESSAQDAKTTDKKQVSAIKKSGEKNKNDWKGKKKGKNGK